MAARKGHTGGRHRLVLADIGRVIGRWFDGQVRAIRCDGDRIPDAARVRDPEIDPGIRPDRGGVVGQGGAQGRRIECSVHADRGIEDRDGVNAAGTHLNIHIGRGGAGIGISDHIAVNQFIVPWAEGA